MTQNSPQRTDVIFFPVILTGDDQPEKLYNGLYEVLAQAVYYHTAHQGDMSGFTWPPWWKSLKPGDRVVPNRASIPVYRDDRRTLWKSVPSTWPPMRVEQVDGEWICVNPPNPKLWVWAGNVKKI